jgi:hypothetical protein
MDSDGFASFEKGGTNMDQIPIGSLQDGDVILYHGKTWLAKAIRFVDGTEVNHAAVCLGNGRVGEALGKGLTNNSISDSINDNDYVVVRRLSSHPGTIQPVVDKAQAYIAIGNRYGFEQIVLLAFLGITRKIPVNIYLKWLLRKVLDQAADLLMKQGNKQPMICSEFVYRCYDEALPTSKDPYTLGINRFPVTVTTSGARAQTFAAAPHRQKMHSDSLLAWAENAVRSGKRAGAGPLIMTFEKRGAMKAAAPVSAEDKRLASLSLDDLIKGYIKETKKPATRTIELEASLRSPEMLASIKNFAEAHYRATSKAPARAGVSWSARAGAGEVPEALDHALKTVENFVTPGDLRNCRDLYDVGEINP